MWCSTARDTSLRDAVDVLCVRNRSVLHNLTYRFTHYLAANVLARSSDVIQGVVDLRPHRGVAATYCLELCKS